VADGVPDGCGVPLLGGEGVTEGVVVFVTEGVTAFVGVSVAVVAADWVASAVGVIVPPIRPASAKSDVAGRPADTWLTASRGAFSSPPPACAVAVISSAEIGTPQAIPAVAAIDSRVRKSARPAEWRHRTGETQGIAQL
jgi:hypothetical protein